MVKRANPFMFIKGSRMFLTEPYRRSPSIFADDCKFGTIPIAAAHNIGNPNSKCGNIKGLCGNIKNRGIVLMRRRCVDIRIWYHTVFCWRPTPVEK